MPTAIHYGRQTSGSRTACNKMVDPDIIRREPVSEVTCKSCRKTFDWRMDEAVRGGVIAEAEQLAAAYATAHALYEAAAGGSGQDYFDASVAEDEAHEALVEFIDGNGLEYSSLDPRGPAAV